jgi:DNA-directed RNA polymerase subunit RPC12/RpoP
VPISCPHCRSKTIRRSKRKGMFESSILRLTPVRPFRCKDCNHRFFGMTSQPDSIQSKNVVWR